MLARFEAGDVAVAEKTDGKGRLVVFASGWQPVDSQLARSSKFVPLYDWVCWKAEATPYRWPGTTWFSIGCRCRTKSTAGKDLLVHKPDGSSAKVPKGSAFVLGYRSARSVHAGGCLSEHGRLP